MPRQTIASDELPTPPLPFSLGTYGGGLLFLSGQVALNPETGKLAEGGVVAETEQVLRNIATALKAAGKTLDDVVRVGVYLTDLDNDFAAMNEVYEQQFSEPYPARTAIGVAKLPAGAKVEMDVVVS